MSDLVFSASIPADARHLKAVREFFRAVLEELYGDETNMLVLALDESCSNVLKHAAERSPHIVVTAERRKQSIRFSIGNFCCEEDVPKIKPRDLRAIRPGGLGTHFIGEIMDRVDYEPDPESPGRMRLVLEKKLPDDHGS